jgi:hypothetical protein
MVVSRVHCLALTEPWDTWVQIVIAVFAPLLVIFLVIIYHNKLVTPSVKLEPERLSE